MEDKEQKQLPIVIRHHCKVCHRGFGCAGALGGHMRTHGIGGDHTGFQTNDGDSIVTRSKSEGISKHSYFLRAHTNRILSHRFDEQGDDHDHDHDNNLVSVRPHDERGKCRVDDGFTRSYICSEEASREEQDLANCLVMLSNKTFINKEENNNNKIIIISSNKQEQEQEDEELEELDEDDGQVHEKGMFQCKACKKYFSSHQALGGHRASHKKVKGCFAAKLTNLINNNDVDVDENNSIEDELINQEEIFSGSLSYENRFEHLDSEHQNRQSSRITKSKSRDHQCSICQRVFTSGQALGGHKRCHWLTSNNIPDTTLIQNLRDQFQFDSPTDMFKKPMIQADQTTFDLNLPPFDLKIKSLSSNYETQDKIFLQLWGNGCNEHMKQHGQRVQESLNGSTSLNSIEEECRKKKVKLKEFKDMNIDGNGSSSRWLQMGMASTDK